MFGCHVCFFCFKIYKIQLKQDVKNGVVSNEQVTQFINAREVDDMTALHHACWKGNVGILEILQKEFSADINITSEGFSPLWKAYFNDNYLCVVSLLLNPNLYISDKDSRQICHMIESKDDKLLKMIRETDESVRKQAYYALVKCALLQSKSILAIQILQYVCPNFLLFLH